MQQIEPGESIVNFTCRATVLPMLLTLLAVAWVSDEAEAQSTLPDRPNIIFIMADDLGYGDLGCYGQRVIRTPSIDRMAREGIRFTQVYAGSTVCAPSRCALMTGRHTGHAWVRGNRRVPLRDEDVTVAEVLKGAGYATGIIGKWGLGNEGTTGVPNKQGFDEWFGYLDQVHAHTYYPEYLWRNEEKVFLEGNVEERRNVAIERTQYSHDLFAEEALSYIRRHRDDTFFLYLALTIPHANNERGAALGDGMEVPDYGAYGDEDWPDPQKGHAAMITRLDSDVGRILDLLRELNLDDHTIVFFTSDNGPHREGGADPDFFNSSGGLRGIKRALYEGGIRVPAIAWGPGLIPAGKVSDQPWAFWDFLPTAAELAGVQAPPSLDGISIAPTLFPGLREQEQHDYFYWEFHEGDYLRAVLRGKWKYVKSERNDTAELFDLSQDLAEQNDLAQDNPELVTQMEAILAEARTPSEHWGPQEIE